MSYFRNFKRWMLNCISDFLFIKITVLLEMKNETDSELN